jgi:hypothetical protein
MMGTIRHFSDFLNQIGSHNFLAIGIVIIVIWLLISGLRKGLKRKNGNRDPEKNNENNNAD